MSKILSAREVPKLVRDGDTITGTGFSFTTPEELFIALEESVLQTGHPRDLTVLIPGGAGDLRGRGFDHFAHDGFIKKIIAPYLNLTPALAKMVLEERVEAYMLPAGTLAQLFREIGGKRCGLLTHVGIGTFVDPRIEGGRMNSISRESYTTLVEIDGKTWLHYRPIHIDVALLKVTTADEFGNSTLEKEAGYLTTLPMAIAAHNCGGKVIEQVERIAKIGTLNPQHVQVPGILVDAVVIARPEKVIARRALYEICPGEVVNLGAGMPEFISAVAWEEKIFEKIVLTVEAGMIGGVPGFGLQFNTASNPHAIIDQSFQMDLYEGGGNDASCVGFAQIDRSGNVNVSEFNSRISGVGGFLNVFPRAKKRVHCGAFTAGKSEIEIIDARMRVARNGPVLKFVDKVHQITLNWDYIEPSDRPTVIVTERAVFHYTRNGLVLREIAPGVDLQKDVLEQMKFEPVISPDLKEMPREIFMDKPLELNCREPWQSYCLY
jgi:propionate CoA-transferase